MKLIECYAILSIVSESYISRDHLEYLTGYPLNSSKGIKLGNSCKEAFLLVILQFFSINWSSLEMI